MEATLVFPHQLFDPSQNRALAEGRLVILVEEALFFGGDSHWPLDFHRKKLILHRAAMKAYADELVGLGFTVHYEDWAAGKTATDVLESLGVGQVHLADPVDDVLRRRLKRWGGEVVLVESAYFLSPSAWLHEQFDGKKKPFMATFYKAQRKRMDILMEGNEPEGGQWSYDEDNRKKLPKGQTVPEVAWADGGDYVRDAQVYVAETFPNALGSAHGFGYPVTRAAAKDWLEAFLTERFHLFGDYEDAISSRHRIIFHSVITPALNVGLLTPQDVVERALEYGEAQAIPLNTQEGFVRQIIGWREFMRAMYERYGVEERNGNFWQFSREMPKCFYDGTTGVEPIDEVIRRVLEDGYCHHIERLMVLGNFMLLCRIHPDAVYRWFMELFVDAYDWVMVPNVYGMSQFADGGIFTTKPYLSGSNYVRKMSDWKKGDWCDVWDGLFWSFIGDYQEVFEKNHRMSRMAWMWRNLSDEKKQAHRDAAEAFLGKLDE